MNKYGRIRLNYLKEYKKAEYTIMFMENTLIEHLEEIQETATKRVNQIIDDLKAKSNLTEDMIKDPFVFELLGVPEKKPLLEKDLEYKLIKHIENFLLELGKGFMFVGSQQRVTIGNVHYYVDMVFYNKILKAYVLIDLKMGNLKPENFGQMNMYLNYYEEEVNDEGDNKPIGIILCAENEEESND